ncbi:Protein of unknown function (DUF1389) [Chlamydia serpentis]|uniref:DUF1389 domain-containing protein n=1 Tax=Chlamydia serpentis TaxID=1967782 RepID=A0A2R8FAY9_9CHLA|nr:DUF1389 domain-containing protein [Chlamydia serpentis]SPN73492.1 Protein of unknown function (DUF1389) [Chlamydia serpentis]
MSCNPITSVSHTLLKNDCLCHKSYSLKHRTIARLVLGLLLALASVPLFIFLSAPISYAVGGTLALVALIVLIITLVKAVAKPSKVHPISKALLDIIYNRYPRKIFDFVKAEFLTVSEFKTFIGCLKSGLNLPLHLNKKAEAFGLASLETIDPTYLPEFEELLLNYCPLHWLFHFISKTQPLSWEALLSKEARTYNFLGPMACHKGHTTIFHPFIRPLISLISEEDYSTLLNLAQNNQWNTPLVEKVSKKLLKKREISSYSLGISKSYTSISQLLFLFFSHHVTWEQAKLLNLLSEEQWSLLHRLDNSTGHLQIAMFGGYLLTQTEMLNPDSLQYEPVLDYLTWEELKILGGKGDPSRLKDGCTLLQDLCSITKQHQNFLTRKHDIKRKMNEVLSTLPIYNFNMKLGKREKIK